MALRDLGNIHTTGNSYRTHFHAWHDTKTTPVFLYADGKASWSLVPSSVSLLSSGTVQPKNIFLYQGNRPGLTISKKDKQQH